MDYKSIFLVFGIVLPCFAIYVTFFGLRYKDFPSRKVMGGLLVLGLFLAIGTLFFTSKLQIQEAHEREEGQKPAGEVAAVAPIHVLTKF